MSHLNTATDPSEQGNTDVCWYLKANEARRAPMICDIASRLWQDQAATREGMLRAARMYGALPMMGLSPRLYRQRTLSRGRRLALNVIKSVVNTYVAMVTKDRPKVSFVTAGGDDALQRRAKRLEKFVDGTCYDQSLHQQAYQLARDSALFTFGIVKFFKDMTDPKKPRVGIERTLPWEWLFDDAESADGKPPNVMHVKFMDRRALARAYPKLANAIMHNANGGGFEDIGESVESVSMVEWCVVIEAWHLPTGGAETAVDDEDGGDDHAGRHTIAVCGVEEPLVDEPWTYHRFPAEILYRERPIQGVHGESLADELAPMQVEISRILMSIQRAQMYAVGHWLVEENSNVNTNAIDDVTASIIRYRGTPPQYHAVNTVASDVYAHLDRLWGRAFEVVGVPQMNAAGQKPAGINSGRGLLVYAEVTSTRFKPCYAEYQDFYMRVAQQIIHWAAEIAEDHPEFEVRAPGKMMDAVKWADVHMREEEYVLQMYPTNFLAEEPAAKLSQVETMMNSGIIEDRRAGRRLLNMPDLEEWSSYEDASYENTMEAARLIIEKGEYFGPIGQMDLKDALRWMQMTFLRARVNKVPQDRLDMLDRWCTEAGERIKEMDAEAAAAGGAPGGPGGQPGGFVGAVQHDAQRMAAHAAAQNMVAA